jgi:hypothetical protein
MSPANSRIPCATPKTPSANKRRRKRAASPPASWRAAPKPNRSEKIEMNLPASTAWTAKMAAWSKAPGNARRSRSLIQMSGPAK